MITDVIHTNNVTHNKAYTIATILQKCVAGVISPYHIVEKVIIVKYKE